MAERPLRILVLANLPPHVLGGAENQVARLVEAWLGAGAHVEVAGHRIPDGEQALGAHRVRTHHLRLWPWLGRAGRGLGYAASLLALVWGRRGDFDVAYCRALGDGALALSLARRLRLCRWPVVVVPINAAGTGDAYFIRSLPFWRTWCRIIDREVAAFNLINAAIADDLDDLGLRRAPRSAIPNGIAIRPLPPRPAPSEVRRLIWTGRFEPQKGLDLLIPALAACRAEGARFVLTLWGDGSRRGAIQEQVKVFGLEDVVVFAGVADTHRIREALADADAFVLPSRYEGMSNAALEAMEAGLPVFCTRCGGIDEYIGEVAGWVCDPANPTALLDTLRSMFATHPAEWLERGKRAREIVETRFAIDAIATRNLEWMAVAKQDHQRQLQ